MQMDTVVIQIICTPNFLMETIRNRTLNCHNLAAFLPGAYAYLLFVCTLSHSSWSICGCVLLEITQELAYRVKWT
ncbi:hypothetical protein P879_06928 [Paragonimus westermani]|uniref:Uncharacterized protein n=1 Tax=Paragonimus westermani TaxID=34504 RepID=A0A8T0DI96_9TREM|nr:hypothetical protein P879_06928 [Paragonimus westermani]